MASWTPSPAQVKALIPQRVRGRPFAEDTTPTASEVSELASQISAEVVAQVGAIPDDDVDVQAYATRVAALGTAAQVELAFFPEQSSVGDTSVGQILYGKYLRGLEKLGELIRGGDGADVVFTGSLETPLPAARRVPLDAERRW